MADRLISADALYKRYQDVCMGVACNACPFLDLQNGCKVENLIDSAPTIEAEPIKHGRWIDKEDPYGFFDTIPVCSECGCTTKMREKYHFCPNCGADMRGGENGI